MICRVEVALFVCLDQQLVHKHNIRLWQSTAGWLDTEPLGDAFMLEYQHLAWPAWNAVSPASMPCAGDVQIPRVAELMILC